MFSAGPAWNSQAAFPYFGGVPFPLRRMPDLAGTVLMNPAPLSQRFNFEDILSLPADTVNRISRERGDFCINRRENFQIKGGGLWYSNDSGPVSD